MTEEAFQRLLKDGQARIDAMVAEQGGKYKEGDLITIPFRCYLCDLPKGDVAFVTGDGLVICAECFPGPIPP